MAVVTKVVSVTGAAVRVDTVDDTTDQAAGESLIPYNNDSATVIYIGGSTVTVANGMPIPPKSYGPAFTLSGTEEIWAITTGAAAELRIAESGV